ncbi:MAG: AAA family ATPase [Caldisericia bacterium]|nr:AAA family ATPase [Caldisericia bacterium]
MLKKIVIQNFVIAKNIGIDLSEGFNVFTGETGAGKTLLIHAILFGVGNSIPKESMGLENSRPYVNLVFSSISDPIKIQLDLAGFEIEENDELFLERTFSSKGKNRTKINGQIASLSFYKQIGKQLIDFHGQRETGTLLQSKKQLMYLDNYIGKDADLLKQQIKNYRKNLSDIIQHIASIENQEAEFMQEKELFEFQIQEIEAVNLKDKEWESLVSDKNRLTHSQLMIDTLENVHKFVSSGDSLNDTASDLIQKAIQQINKITEFSVTSRQSLESLETVDSILKDIIRDVNSELSDLTAEYDDKKLRTILERLDTIQNLHQKYGFSFSQITTTLQKKKTRLLFLSNQNNSLLELKNRETTIRSDLQRYCIKIHSLRKEASISISRQIEKHLHELSMPDAKFIILFSENTRKETSSLYVTHLNNEVSLDDTGFDNIAFHFQANQGMSPLSIQSVASGGELSRIMLSIKASIGNELNDDTTFIFDEIDSGINGLTGNVVGAKLKTISQKHQTICITHLPQIASFGNSHYSINKSSISSSTISSVELLSKDKIILEIARMMGGNNLSDVAINHAKEMVEHAKNSFRESSQSNNCRNKGLRDNPKRA